MVTKHFLKILMIFILMIIIGLIGVSIVNYFNQNSEQEINKNTKEQIAK